VRKIQKRCDKCKRPVKDVGRLIKVKWKGITQRLCKECRKKLGIYVR